MGLLVGRDEAVNLLLHAYNKTRQWYQGQLQELVLIRGHSGTGKTALAKSLTDMVVEDSGFFLTAKFELKTMQNPYGVIAAAFDQFTDQLLYNQESKRTEASRTAAIRQVIQEAVGREGKLLTNMIPSLERLMGKQEDTCDVRSSEVVKRFQFVSCKFCHAICTVSPLVLFFDDLQWSDAASLDLILSLIQFGEMDKRKSSLLVIGTYREESVGDESLALSSADLPDLPLLSYLKQFDKLSDTRLLSLTRVYLTNLDEASMACLVERHLELAEEESTSNLARMVHCSSAGNPFHAVQLLHLLENQGHLHRDSHYPEKWVWDEANILLVTQSVDTVDEIVRRKIASLPELIQQVLQVAASIGDKVDFLALSTVLNQASVLDIERSLHVATREGFFIYERQLALFRFVHDRIRQVVLSSVDDLDGFYFDIGQKLWMRSPPHFLSTKLFVVTNLLNYGIRKVTIPSERIKAAALNLEAGVLSASLAAFADASKYLKAGIDFLEGGDYWTEHYELALSLFSASADAAVGSQNFVRAGELTDVVLQHARNIKDSVVAYRAKINYLGQMGLVREATAAGFEALEQLGERMPHHPSQIMIAAEIIKTKILIRWCSDSFLLRRSALDDDENKVAAIQILTTLWPYIYRSGSANLQLLATRLVLLCLKHTHKDSAFGFVTYGSIFSIDENSEGYRLGGLALFIVEKYHARELVSRVHLPFYSFIHHWKRPLKESVEFLQQTDLAGMQFGDVEYAMLALSFKCLHSLCCGIPLAQLDGWLVEAMQRMRLYHQHSILQRAKILLQFIHNLTGRAPDPKILSGDVVGPNDASADAHDMSIPFVRFVFGADLAFMFDDLELAEHHAERRRNLNFVPKTSYVFVMCRFKEALICIARARVNLDRKKNIKIAKGALKQMAKWAHHCKENYLHKQRLIEAELKTLRNRWTSASRQILALYEQSIEGALREDFIQEAALACELCGCYLDNMGERVRAEELWTKACDFYLSWGATEKVAHLRQKTRMHELGWGI